MGKNSVDTTQRIEDLIKLTIGELESIENESSKQKQETIRKLAKDLEKYLPIEMICDEICHQIQLKSHLMSTKEIRKCLDDKYKQKQKQNREESTSQVKTNKFSLEDKKVLEVSTNGNEDFVIDNTAEPPEEFKSLFADVERNLHGKEVPPEISKEVERLRNALLKQSHDLKQIQLQKMPEKMLILIYRDQYDEVKDAMRASPTGFIAIESDGKKMLAAIDNHSAKQLIGETAEPIQK